MAATEQEMLCRVELVRDFNYGIDDAEEECRLDYESLYDYLRTTGGCPIAE